MHVKIWSQSSFIENKIRTLQKSDRMNEVGRTIRDHPLNGDFELNHKYKEYGWDGIHFFLSSGGLSVAYGINSMSSQTTHKTRFTVVIEN